MKSIDETEAQARLDEMLAEAQRIVSDGDLREAAHKLNVAAGR